MDPHIRWLRRHVLARVLTRLVVEGAVVAVLGSATGVLLGLDPLTAIMASVVAAHLYSLLRLGVAIWCNPVNHRYLSRWEDHSQHLRPSPPTKSAERPLDADLGRIGLRHLVRLDRSDMATDGYEVYASGSRLVLAAVGAGGGQCAILSRLSDGRLLVTSPDLVPPSHGVMINLAFEGSPSELVLRHIETLTRLRHQGLSTLPAGYDLLIDQLRLEWQAWDELGPIIGPLLAIDPRPQPHLLQARVPADLLWRRSSAPTTNGVVRHRFVGPAVQASPGAPLGGARSVVVEIEVPRPGPATGLVGLHVGPGPGQPGVARAEVSGDAAGDGRPGSGRIRRSGRRPPVSRARRRPVAAGR